MQSAVRVELLVDDRVLPTHATEGGRYVEATAGKPYKLRVTNVRTETISIQPSVDNTPLWDVGNSKVLQPGQSILLTRFSRAVAVGKLSGFNHNLLIFAEPVLTGDTDVESAANLQRVGRIEIKCFATRQCECSGRHYYNQNGQAPAAAALKVPEGKKAIGIMTTKPGAGSFQTFGNSISCPGRTLDRKSPLPEAIVLYASRAFLMLKGIMVPSAASAIVQLTVSDEEEDNATGPLLTSKSTKPPAKRAKWQPEYLACDLTADNPTWETRQKLAPKEVLTDDQLAATQHVTDPKTPTELAAPTPES